MTFNNNSHSIKTILTIRTHFVTVKVTAMYNSRHNR